jgi:hypothetical protein
LFRTQSACAGEAGRATTTEIVNAAKAAPHLRSFT